MTRILQWGLCALFSVVLPATVVAATTTQTRAANVTAKRLLNAESEPAQWMTYGGTYDEQRYSRLNQINPDNVKDLGLSWFVDLDSNLSQDSTPLYIDGVLYVTTPWSIVYAYDAGTGREIWRFDPQTPREWARKVCCGLVTRGIAAWNGKIYTGTLDARLVAIDASTGKQVWSILTLDQTRMDEPTERYSITMAPRIVNGKVLVGNSGSEFGVRGYVSAYDAETGKLLWRFYTAAHGPHPWSGLRRAKLRRSPRFHANSELLASSPQPPRPERPAPHAARRSSPNAVTPRADTATTQEAA